MHSNQDSFRPVPLTKVLGANLSVLGQVIFTVAALTLGILFFAFALWFFVALAAIFLIIGLFVSAGNFFGLLRDWRLLRRGVMTSATVVEEIREDEDLESYKVRYTDNDGNVREGTFCRRKSGPAHYKAGEVVRIVVNKQKPADFVEVSDIYDDLL